MQAVQGFPGCAEGHGAVMGKWEVAPDCDLSDNQGLRWQSRRTCAHLLLRELQSYNLLLNNHQQENVGSTKKKDTLHTRAKEKSQQDGRRGEVMLRTKPHTHQRCLKSSNKNLCVSGDPTETEPDLTLSV